ncbi:hypothetical protein BC831DRAFT_455289 [Entophlyctis helioformis]|nr:hypothetical protein BC831DRAFT_455289 [Entophlyctis helioformis]
MAAIGVADAAAGVASARLLWTVALLECRSSDGNTEMGTDVEGAADCRGLSSSECGVCACPGWPACGSGWCRCCCCRCCCCCC